MRAAGDVPSFHFHWRRSLSRRRVHRPRKHTISDKAPKIDSKSAAFCLAQGFSCPQGRAFLLPNTHLFYNASSPCCLIQPHALPRQPALLWSPPQHFLLWLRELLAAAVSSRRGVGSQSAVQLALTSWVFVSERCEGCCSCPNSPTLLMQTLLERRTQHLAVGGLPALEVAPGHCREPGLLSECGPSSLSFQEAHELPKEWSWGLSPDRSGSLNLESHPWVYSLSPTILPALFATFSHGM